MPDVFIKNQRFYYPVDFVPRQIGGTWKAPVLWRLKSKSFMYSELEKNISHISQKMLTKTLKEMEADDLIRKLVFAEVPPHTEYSLSEKDKKAVTLIESILNFGLKQMKEAGIDYEQMVKEDVKLKKEKSNGVAADVR